MTAAQGEHVPLLDPKRVIARRRRRPRARARSSPLRRRPGTIARRARVLARMRPSPRRRGRHTQGCSRTQAATPRSGRASRAARVDRIVRAYDALVVCRGHSTAPAPGDACTRRKAPAANSGAAVGQNGTKRTNHARDAALAAEQVEQELQQQRRREHREQHEPLEAGPRPSRAMAASINPWRKSVGRSSASAIAKAPVTKAGKNAFSVISSPV